MIKRIESLLHRHSDLCTLVCALMMVIAASYLIPANPDSATFRSGTLGFIAIAACAVPVRHAFGTMHSARSHTGAHSPGSSRSVSGSVVS